MSKALKIISLPVDTGGCGWYRIRQPFEMIKRYTEHDTHIIDNTTDDMVSVLEALSIADIVVCRQGSEVALPGLKQAVNDYLVETKRPVWKTKFVLDIDDNIELISPYSEHYSEYGMEEFYDHNLGKWLWKDGEAKFDLAHNRSRVDQLKKGMKEADLVTVTTEKLAEYARQYNPSVAVLPNCINFERWWRLPLRPNRQLRVGWSGGISHYEDWYSIKAPLNDLMRKYQFKLVTVGSNFDGVIDEDNKHLVEVQDWVPFKGHSYRMMCMALDIAIVPLANTPFNQYKSSIKWYEMSALGVPSIVSNILPYAEDVNQANAMPYKNESEFHKALEFLIKSPTVRERTALKAMEYVHQFRDARQCATLWTDAYAAIL